MKKNKLLKIRCEICGETNKSILHKHHLKEQTEIDTNNDSFNLAVLCPSCHAKIHLTKSIKILGVWPSTNEQGRILVYEKNGVCNVPSLQNASPPINIKPKSMKLYIKEDNE